MFWRKRGLFAFIIDYILGLSVAVDNLQMHTCTLYMCNSVTLLMGWMLSDRKDTRKKNFARDLKSILGPFSENTYIDN